MNYVFDPKTGFGYYRKLNKLVKEFNKNNKGNGIKITIEDKSTSYKEVSIYNSAWIAMKISRSTIKESSINFDFI